LARAGVAMASVESFIRKNPATKIVDVEDTQVPCTVPEPAEECMKLSPSPVNRRSAIVSPEDVYCDAAVPQLTTDAEGRRCGLEENAGEVSDQSNTALRKKEYQTRLVSVPKEIRQHPKLPKLRIPILTGEPSAMQVLAPRSHIDSKPVLGSEAVLGSEPVLGSELPRSLATMLDAALASGDLARAVDLLIAEQGVLTFRYTWLQHSQTPLPQHLENERKRLGINEDDWQTHLSITDHEGFYLDVSDPLREDQFPAGVEFDARRS
jgi:hypothetical protein